MYTLVNVAETGEWSQIAFPFTDLLTAFDCRTLVLAEVAHVEENPN